jgi:hypothetical protein
LKKNKTISKTFFIFIAVSLGFWLLTTLSKTYSTSIAFPIVYQKFSQNKLLKEAPIKKLNIFVEATGFKIFSCKLLNKPIHLKTSKLQRKSKDLYYFLPKKQKKNITQQLTSKLKIVEIIEDTIFLKIGTLETKKIPVQPNLKINYKVGYKLLGDVNLLPDSILVSGPKSKLKTIDKVQLKELMLTNVFEDFNQAVLVKSDTSHKNLKFHTKQVEISGKVEQFTERSFEVPFEIINVALSNNDNLTTLTKKVRLTFTVGLTEFENITKEDFLIVCDYRLAKENNLNFLIPKLTKKPSQINNYTITPNKIDFLIKKEL